MGKVCRLEVNGDVISARRGDLLLDTALLNGVDIPHDCRSGHCGTCRVRLLGGRVFGGKTDDPEMIYACQSRIVSDLRVAVEDVPETVILPGVVADVTPLAPDVCEVAIEASERPEYFPGQYYAVQFRGFPARYFSPTVPLDWPSNESLVRFHIKRVPNGVVSASLGRRICAGHRVKLQGPFGSAYLRPFAGRRLVLVAGGTGFAPIWSIAEAAIRSEPRRELVLIVAARTVESLYMLPALCRLALFPNVTIIPVVGENQNITPAIRCGRPTDHVPELNEQDIVFAAGAPDMVRAVARIAKTAGAKCYTDPFEASAHITTSDFWSRAAAWLSKDAPPSRRGNRGGQAEIQAALNAPS